jgi:hypothetical protein
MTTNPDSYLPEPVSHDSAIRALPPHEVQSADRDRYWRERIALPEVSTGSRCFPNGFLYAFCAGLLGGTVGGVMIPGAYGNLFTDFGRGFLLFGAMIGATLGMPMGLFAGVVAGAVGATTSDPKYTFRIHCIVSACAFCATAALAGWVAIQFLVAAWASC